MKRRKWDPKTKALIIVQGLKGKPVSEICLEHQISQAQYYQWRDQFLANAHQVFTENDKKEEKLNRENTRLRKIIGDLTVEFKNRRVAGMRKESASTRERNLPVVDRIKQIKTEHPFWGYRRMWAYLRYVDELEINKKRVLRLMQRHDLLVKPDTKLKAKRTAGRSKPRPEHPNQWWGIDMTKVMVSGFGWMYITVGLDWYTKKIVGYYAGIQCRGKHWLEALDEAVNRQFPDGVREHGLCLMSDNGSQPTSVGFMKSCRELGIHQAFTSYNNPKENADTERVFRTMKEELLWLREWTSPFELTDALQVWIPCYNGSYLHSALGYKLLNKFEEEYENNQLTLLATP